MRRTIQQETGHKLKFLYFFIEFKNHFCIITIIFPVYDFFLFQFLMKFFIYEHGSKINWIFRASQLAPTTKFTDINFLNLQLLQLAFSDSIKKFDHSISLAYAVFCFCFNIVIFIIIGQCFCNIYGKNLNVHKYCYAFFFNKLIKINTFLDILMMT